MRTLLLVMGLGILLQSYSQAQYDRYGRLPPVNRAPKRFVPAPEAKSLDAYKEANKPIQHFFYKGRHFPGAILTRYSAKECFVKIESGVVRVTWEELPEAFRAKHYPKEEVERMAAEEERAKAEAIARQKKAMEEKAERELAARKSEEEMQEALVRNSHPVRFFEGKVYDLTALLVERYSQTDGGQMARFYVVGRVRSINEDGLLINTTEDAGPFATVFLKNYPRQGSIVDDTKIATAAFHAGHYSYVSVLGARKRVPLFDYGTPTSRPSDGSILRVSSDGNEAH